MSPPWCLALTLLVAGCTAKAPGAAPTLAADAGLGGADAGPAAAELTDAGGAIEAALPPASEVFEHLDAGPEVRFVAVGDTGKGSPQQRQVGAAMARVCARLGCDFVALLGDNFYPSGVTSVSDPQWETAFVQPYQDLPGPFFVVLGNHDYGGNGSGYELEKAQVQVAYSRVNPRWRMPGTHYRFSVGPVDFFAADTNRSMYALDGQVRADFSRWLRASRAPWRIVLGHHPLRSNGRHGNAGSYDGVAWVPIANGASVKSFLEQEVCGQADLYLCGHEHLNEWLEPTCGRPGSTRRTELVIAGGGSSPTTFSPRPPNQDHFRAEGLGFVRVVIRGDTLTGTFYDGDGAERFTRSFTRTGPPLAR